MQTIFFIIEIAATVFEGWVLLKCLNDCFAPKLKNNKLPFIGALLLENCYLLLINNVTAFEGILSIVTIGIFIAYAMIFLEGMALMKIVIVFIEFSVILAINMLVISVNSFTLQIADLLTDPSIYRLISLLITKLLFFAVSKLVVKFYRKEKFSMNSPELIASASMISLTHIMAIILVTAQMNGGNAALLIFIAILSAVLTDVFIIYVMHQISNSNKNKLRISLLEMQLSEKQQMTEATKQISKEIKKTEHDLKHHLMSILGVLENGDRDEAIHYLKTLLEDYETSIFKYVSLDNEAISSILNFKIGKCRTEHIDFKIEIESDFEDYNEVDICVLLSNLLDNAIEASASVKKPQITLSIKKHQNYLCILVRNRIEESVLAKNKLLQTTKKNQSNHGLGIYSIGQIVEKYDGMKNYYEENSFFVADIWLKSFG